MSYINSARVWYIRGHIVRPRVLPPPPPPVVDADGFRYRTRAHEATTILVCRPHGVFARRNTVFLLRTPCACVKKQKPRYGAFAYCYYSIITYLSFSLKPRVCCSRTRRVGRHESRKHVWIRVNARNTIYRFVYGCFVQNTMNRYFSFSSKHFLALKLVVCTDRRLRRFSVRTHFCASITVGYKMIKHRPFLVFEYVLSFFEFLFLDRRRGIDILLLLLLLLVLDRRRQTVTSRRCNLYNPTVPPTK